MEAQIIFKIKTAILKYSPDLSCSIIEYHGLINHESYKEIMEKAYNLIIEKKLTNWISDLTDMKVILPENQKWTNEYFLPKVLKTTKINKVAIIVGNDVFTHASMNKIKEEVSKANLPIRYFDNFIEIENWFKEVNAATPK